MGVVKSVPFKVHPYIFLDKTVYIAYLAIKLCILSSLIFPQIVSKFVKIQQKRNFFENNVDLVDGSLKVDGFCPKMNIMKINILR